jgi:hypothetical protein
MKKAGLNGPPFSLPGLDSPSCPVSAFPPSCLRLALRSRSSSARVLTRRKGVVIVYKKSRPSPGMGKRSPSRYLTGR